MANRNTGKRSSNGAKTPAASPASSNGTIPNEKAPECAAATDTSSAEFRQLVVQTQVRSLRRRLWHAFQREDADTALRAYKATAKDLQDWVREEIQEARDREARRLQQEKVRPMLCVHVGCFVTACGFYLQRLFHWQVSLEYSFSKFKLN